jgi:hypothetical protein
MSILMDPPTGGLMAELRWQRLQVKDQLDIARRAGDDFLVDVLEARLAELEDIAARNGVAGATG